MNASRIASRVVARRTVTTLAACAAALGALSSGVATAAPAGPPPSFWMPTGNDSLLLNADAVARLVGAAGMGVRGVSSQFADSSQRVTPADCAPLYQPAEATAYPHATNVTTVAMDDEKQGFATRLVQQSVVGYADASVARREFGAVAATWASCAGAKLTTKSASGKSKEWTMGLPAPSDQDAVRVVTNLGPGAVCERALSTRAAIIVDVMSCALGGGDAAGQAGAVAAKIRDNVIGRDG